MKVVVTTSIMQWGTPKDVNYVKIELLGGDDASGDVRIGRNSCKVEQCVSRDTFGAQRSITTKEDFVESSFGEVRVRRKTTCKHERCHIPMILGIYLGSL